MNADSISYLTARPAYPWSEGTTGLVAFGIMALFLVAITLWSYLGQPQTNSRRLGIMIGIRLLALLLALLVMIRPSLAIEEDPKLPSTLIIAADASESMTIQDELNNQTRYETLKQTLAQCEPILKQLKDEQNITVELYRFAADFTEARDRWDPNLPADGKRTDFGTMLARLYDRYQGEPYLRGLLVLSDGIDNGTERPTLAEAARWRNINAPIHTFALGQTTTNSDQRDLAITAISPDPSPVAIKGKLTVKAKVNAYGLEGAKVQVRLFFDDKEVKTDNATLLKRTDNEVEITTDAPTTPGEVKVGLKIDPLSGELTTVNNSIETYVTVTKEGLSVLIVDKPRLELKFIRYALASDKRIRYFEATRATDDASVGDVYQFDQQFYDVIILGDVSAKRLGTGGPRVMERISDMVRNKGVGLMMMGGIDSFGGTPGEPGSGDWPGTLIADLLPVDLAERGQVEQPIVMSPTRDGLAHYLLRLDPNPMNNEELWRRLNDPQNKTLLNGMTRMGRDKPGSIVLARVGDPVKGPPLLVGSTVGKGRVLAFGADSTWNWRRLGIPQRIGQPVSNEGVELHQRFWKQVVLWLAQQDENEGNAFITPEFRRLAVRGKQTFRMGLKGKTGLPIADARLRYQILAPGEQPNSSRERTPERDADGNPRVLYEPLKPGEYRVMLKANGKDADGSDIEADAIARFIVYPDVSDEMMRQAADHEFLTKLADRANGQFHRAEELPRFLEELKTQAVAKQKPKPRFTPDWRRDAQPWFLPMVLLAFVGLLGGEWGLRRAWGLV